MKNFQFILILILFTSCTDRTDFKDIGKATLEAIIKNDTVELKKLFSDNMDNLDEDTKKELFSEILNYKDKNYSIIKSDTTSNEVTSLVFSQINTYFSIDRNIYLLCTDYDKDDKGIISIENIYISNLTEKCNEWKTNPYCPKFDITIKSLTWRMDYLNKTIKSGKVTLENQTDYDINFIKFRVILKYNNQIFFNQTTVYESKIYAGDITTIDVSGMQDLYTGFTLSNNKFQFDAILIEVKPKPKSAECLKLLELR
ncbi:MAG: hypothetical protein IPH57_10015 [Saprospiraceae bacterium]|nr:hypothetical protein [Saprospiraceae bacterium]